jgi:hypothetical protein
MKTGQSRGPSQGVMGGQKMDQIIWIVLIKCHKNKKVMSQKSRVKIKFASANI